MQDCLADCPEAQRPDVRFYRFLPAAPLPRRAGRDAMGQLPMRAARYCDAATAASAFGWWLFPPMHFSLLWNGSRILWTWGGRDRWFLLDAAQFPGYAAAFDAAVPTAIRGYSPPFLTALPEPATVQIWTGFFARSAPGWSLLVRPPANLGSGEHALTYEGIVESDVWFGPVFANLRFTRQNEAIHFSTERPILQVQPVRRSCYSEAALNTMSLAHDLDELTPADWDDYAKTIVQRNQASRDTVGSYAIAARRRRKMDCGAA